MRYGKTKNYGNKKGGQGKYAKHEWNRTSGRKEGLSMKRKRYFLRKHF